MNELKFDLIVIGGGAGTKLVKPVADMGKKVAIIEMEKMGGTCLNRGCIPSKMLIYPADLLQEAKRLNRFELDRRLEIPPLRLDKLVDRINRTVTEEANSIPPAYDRHEHITYFNHRARFVSDHLLEVGGKYLTAPRIVIAVGSRPYIPDIAGLTQVPYMTSREFLKNEILPSRLTVIGGGFIACEMACAYASFGVGVNILVRSQFLKHLDADIKSEFLKGKPTELKIHENVQIQNVSYSAGEFKINTLVGDKPERFDSEALLVASGIVPQTSELGLENTGVKLTATGHIHVDDCMQSTVPGIYAIGDVAGNFFFRHSANFEGEYLFDQLFKGHKDGIDYPPMPNAVFSYPQMASVGMSEGELIKAGVPYIKGAHTYKSSAMGMARQSEYGLVKLLFQAQDLTLLGAHIVGDEAATMIHTLIAFINMKATLPDLLRTIYIHPALPEVIRNAARKARDNTGKSTS